MRRIAKAVWSYLLALADRVRFYVACARESDIIDVGIGCALFFIVLGAVIFCAGAMPWFCKWVLK